MSEQSDPNQGPPSYVYHGTNGILPPFIKELLNNWPPNRTHWHILSIANRLRHYIPAEEAVELIRAHMPRGEKKGEIEETIKRAYDVQSIRKTDPPPDLQPDVTEIGQIVGERIGPKSALTELEEKSPASIPDSTDEILRCLFDPEELICVANDVRNARTRQLKQFSFAGNAEWIVPNPMSAPFVLDSEGKRHHRSLANTGPRRFLVCDLDIKPGPLFDPLIAHWAKHSVSIQEAEAALIGYLAEYGPLTMVVYSGNVSLQAWFYCQGESETKQSRLRAFFESAMILGADRVGWTRCQLFRMPLGTRSSTGKKQSVHYFDPETIHRSADEN